MTKILTDLEKRALATMRANVEGSEIEMADGSKWRDVYLDNARPHGVSVREFCGVLGSLEKKGLYKDQGGDCFGLVRVDDNSNGRSR